MGNFEETIDDCSRAIKIDSKCAEAYYKRGSANRNLKKFDDAVRDYTKALELNPNYSEAFLSRGIARESLNQ